MSTVVMESPFRENFDTNYVPTDAEVEQIRAHITPYEAELARLESLVRDLTIQRARVKNYIEPHKALISYPRRLPQDVVEEIFLACLPARHNAVMSPATAPLLLGRICSAWRSIAFAMPRLWVSIHISVEFVAQSEERKAAFVDWLKRSAELPLAISCRSETAGGYAQSEAVSTVVDGLVPFASRWHSLDISNIHAIHFTKLCVVDAPRLADIRVAFLEPFNTADWGQYILASNLFHTAGPAVTITATTVGVLVPTTSFTWIHLTHLILHCTEGSWASAGLHFEAAYRLLQGCPRLKSLEFPCDSSSVNELGEPLLLPLLESLVIYDQSSHGDAFVHPLVMPGLDRFHLLAFPPTTPTSDIAFLEHLARHSPLISDLKLSLIDFADTFFLLAALRRFPSLASLDLSLWYRDFWNPQWVEPEAKAVEFLEDIDPTGFPALKELIMRSEWFEDETWEYFLQKQLESGTRLQRFELNFSCNAPDIIPDVRMFLSRGLDVCLKYTPVDNLPNPTPWDGVQ
ncbi:hypothetical protein DFH06DRAFT_691571 [Mycena polygramma]|nr:hypothetical protein DFH06DRAFT_691571 [Mycena polygramma]